LQVVGAQLFFNNKIAPVADKKTGGKNRSRNKDTATPGTSNH
jgi:hypothetical protein